MEKMPLATYCTVLLRMPLQHIIHGVVSEPAGFLRGCKALEAQHVGIYHNAYRAYNKAMPYPYLYNARTSGLYGVTCTVL